RIAAPAPATAAAALFTVLLAQRGVHVPGLAGEGTVPASAAELAGIDSPPLADVVGQMLRESDNLTAELVLKELGRLRSGGSAGSGGSAPGTTSQGVEVVREVLTGIHVPVDGLHAN